MNCDFAIGLVDELVPMLDDIAEPRDPEPCVPIKFTDFLKETLKLDLAPAFQAITDAADGTEVELDDETCMVVFGCKASELPGEMRRVVLSRMGGRAGKSSRLLSTKAIHAAFTVPLPTLAQGEHAWALIVAPDTTLAMQTLNFARGYFETFPELRKHVVNGRKSRDPDEPAQVGTITCITVKRPHDGHLVDIRIGVASSGGKWGRGKTLVCALFDEAEFFQSDSDKVVTDRDLFQACIQRVVPGGQLWMASTPWIEGFGVMEELFGVDFGRHTESLVCQAPTRLMNPTWDPDRTIEAHMRRTDPENAAREIDAIPLPAGSKLFFPPALIEASVNRLRKGELMHLPPRPELQHYAGTDLGFVVDSSGLVITRAEPVDAKLKVRVVFHRNIKPRRGEPLKPSEVCAGFAADLTGYRCFHVMGDLHYARTAHEEFAKVAVEDPLSKRKNHIQYLDFVPTAENTLAAFSTMRDRMSSAELELPYDERMLAQLRRVTSKPTPQGGVKIILPRVGGMHGDIIVALAIAVSQVQLHASNTSVASVRGKRTMGAEPRLSGEEQPGRRRRGGPDLPSMGGY